MGDEEGRETGGVRDEDWWKGYGGVDAGEGASVSVRVRCAWLQCDVGRRVEGIEGGREKSDAVTRSDEGRGAWT